MEGVLHISAPGEGNELNKNSSKQKLVRFTFEDVTFMLAILKHICEAKS